MKNNIFDSETATFDPNAAAAADSGIFGLPFNTNQAALVLIPVPWEATTSYGGGTSLGPEAILQASKQVDLFDIDHGNFFMSGIAMETISDELIEWNREAREAAKLIIDADDELPDLVLQQAKDKVNFYSKKINDYVYTQTKHFLDQGKQVGIVGGDHSVPFGAIQAFLEKYPDMGILHIDAHADLRNAYEGFDFSHASIMYNVMTKTNLSQLVQVGIRDFCEEEFNFIQTHSNKIHTFFDADLASQKMQGKNWSLICDDIVAALPKEVYVSFDIDGLDPKYCPHTGTPVPGGLEFQEVLFLLKKVAASGRSIIGFDLNEVSPGEEGVEVNGEWDANVGARLLYKLCGWTLKS